MLHAQTLERLGDEFVAGAMEGGVDHLEGVGHLLHRRLVVDLAHDVGEELLIGLRSHEGDQAALYRLVIVHADDGIEEVQLGHLLGDGVGVVGGQLGAVLPVDLVAVVLLGVVAGGDVDAGDAVVLTDGEGHLRSGAQGLEEPHLDAVARHDAGRLLGELSGVVAAVEADGHATLHGLLPLGLDDLGKGLGGVADHMDVHLVQTHAHGAAKTGGAELQGCKETAFDLLFVAGNALQLGLLLGGQGGAVEPLFICISVGHWKNLPSSLLSKL